MSAEPQKTSDNEVRENLPTRSDQASAMPVMAETRLSRAGELPANDERRLVQLFQRASSAHELAKQGAIQFCRHSIEAGAALLEAHDLCPRGTWGAWLKDHFAGSPRTAQRYMKQAKSMLMGGSATDLSQNPSEELVSQFTAALARLERRRSAAISHGDNAAEEIPADAPAKMAECLESAPPRAESDPLVPVLDLCDELIAALGAVIESGERPDWGQFVLEELERIKCDLEACRLQLGDGRDWTTSFD